MASYHGPKAKVQRRFGEVLIPRPKYAKILEKRGFPPGQHGKEKQFKSSRRSDYSQQLTEKQKLQFIYNIREGQLRRYFMRAQRQPGNTGTNLLALLERRLDNLVYKAGFAATVWAARQVVGHGHILVDGKRVDLPSFLVKPGQTISVVEKMRRNVHVVEALEGGFNINYLKVDKNAFSATLMYIPGRDELTQQINESLIVEFYNRLT
jgi:small subunit ribosomal protein S4